MTFSFAIVGSIAATTLKFVKNARTQEQRNSLFKCKKVTNIALSLENKLGFTVQELIFYFDIK